MRNNLKMNAFSHCGPSYAILGMAALEPDVDMKHHVYGKFLIT